MAKYIDADALGEVVVIVNGKPVVPYWTIKEMKGEDVAPVTHAYWIMGGSQKYDEGAANIMHCSNCKAYFRYIGRKKNINYCYRCGAVMEGIKDAKIHKHR